MTLLEYAMQQQVRFDQEVPASVRKALGHFGTPAPIAQYMARMFTFVPDRPLRILDPGAGVGTLTAALCDRLLHIPGRREVYCELWEFDPRLASALVTTMEHCREVFATFGHRLTYTVRPDDFVLAHKPGGLFGAARSPCFDLAITNPPYFKIRRDSEHAKAMPHVVHGQPNIYALFMAGTAAWLADNGQMVAITPRSYFSGTYFQRFRKWFLRQMAITHIHSFESRDQAFRKDKVLQENVIVAAQKRSDNRCVKLTHTQATDFESQSVAEVPRRLVVSPNDKHAVIRVPLNSVDREILESLDQLPTRFRDLELSVSTGPVVDFRATEHLLWERSRDSAPLVWMHNVRPFTIAMDSLKAGKPPYIRVSPASRRILLPAKRYVLVKRFTAKEERRRIVAGIVSPCDSYAEWIGIENHVNYIHATAGELSFQAAIGLAAYLNSELVDRYIRMVSGNTQVNASEIRSLPVPRFEAFERIGESLCTSSLEVPGAVRAETVVGAELGLSQDLVTKLCELLCRRKPKQYGRCFRGTKDSESIAPPKAAMQ